MAISAKNEEAQPVALMPHLLVTQGPQQGTRIPLNFAALSEKPLVLGRSAGEADVVLQSQQHLVSRKHAMISFRTEDGVAVVSDAGSSNGTRLNNEFIAGVVPLIPGDVIACGDVELLFVVPIPGMPPRRAGQGYLEDSEPGMARLVVVSSQVPYLRPGSFVRLSPRHPFLLGRHSTCDLRLLEEGEAASYVSRRHAEIRWGNGRYIIRDQGAANPAWVNQRPISGSYELQEGDTIQIASTILKYRAPRMAMGPERTPAAKPAPARTAILRYASRWVLHLGAAVLVLPAEKPVTIGRANGTDLHLQDPSVSRTHAVLRYEGQRYVVEDEGSANGTRVNGQPISTPVALNPGDRIQFGEFEFIFQELGPEALAQDGLPKEPSVSLIKPVTLQFALGSEGNLVAAAPVQDGAAAAGPRAPSSRTMMTSLVPREKLLEAAPKIEYKGSFEEICLKVGTPLTVGGNEPFLLDDKESCWLVVTGKVEVFAVQVSNGQPANTRYHVGSIVAGQALLGMDSNLYGEGLGLLAVATVNTELLKMPAFHLENMAKVPELAPVVIRIINDWIGHLTADITRDVLTSGAEVLLEPGQEYSIEPTQKVTPRKEGLWVRFLQGDALLLGEEELVPPTPELIFPIFGKNWFQATGSCKIATFNTEAIIAQNGSWEGLHLFYEIFFRIKFISIRLATYDEINRLRKKAEYDIKVGRTALANLANVLEAGEEPATAAESSQDLLVQASQLVGKAQGIDILAPPPRDDQKLRNPLEDIARVSQIQTRLITLEDGWWKKESGPILGFMEKGKISVALLPVSGNAYEMVRPDDGSRVRVNAEVAAKLDKSAYIFYRAYPNKALKIRDLLQFGFRGTRRDLLVVLALGIAGGIIGLLVPIVTGFLFDSVIPTADRTQLLYIMAGLIVAALSTAAFLITRSIAILRLETKVDVNTQAATWIRLLALPTNFFRNYSVGDLANRAMGFDTIRQILSSSVITAVLSSIFSLFSFFLLFTYDLGLALVALGLVIITLLVVILVSAWQLRYQRKLTAKQGKISGLVLQLLTGIAKLRVAGAEVRAFAVWAKEFAEQRKLAFKTRWIGNLLAVFNAAWPIIIFVVLFWAVDVLNNRNLSTGSFLAFVSAFNTFLAAVISMAFAVTSILQAIPVYERAKPILETLPEVDLNKADPGELSGSIEVNHVFFRYNEDSPYVLNDVNLQFKPGEFVAIVGPSGAGKSSLFRLLLGFDGPESGSIYYDNQDIKGLDLPAVRRQIGVVMQNSKLMPGDIFSNIVGNMPFTYDDAWEAARLAGIDQDIRDMPMGMFTLISEGGSTLSGGQRQRLMISRSIIGRPRILLFDEATSALDNRTQAIVSESLEKLQATRIVIAHRLSTIVNADRIYVLQGGKIAQSGTYKELIDQPGPFQELATRQLA